MDDICPTLEILILLEFSIGWRLITLSTSLWILFKVYETPFPAHPQGIVEISPDHHYHVNYARSNGMLNVILWSIEYARIFAEPSLTDRDCYFDPGVVTFSFPFHSIHPTGYTFRNGGGRGIQQEPLLFLLCIRFCDSKMDSWGINNSSWPMDHSSQPRWRQYISQWCVLWQR